MRKPIIAGNWKMNMDIEGTKALVGAIIPLARESSAEVVICPSFTNIALARHMTEGTNVQVGAQNMHFEPKGAYTGEVSAEMLKCLGVQYVIIGHSERRQYFGETDESVNKKVKAVLESGMSPIMCVGETLEQREQGVTKSLVCNQVKEGMNGLSADDAAKTVIAYEPVWAIGTGKTATANDANEVCGWIRDTLREMFGKIADDIRIQYGGSMNPGNVKELMAMPEIDGGLIGGASLKAEDFDKLINYDK